ncbi:hypothetical protein HBI56_156140 [Parastagonospora nodorum]|nr:hypothetical protein HBH56_118830 [Parastagonospora nodorum]KAH3928743.1 hypothetical protein HBH54_130360 [Parastagonospora nodorum]KAH3974105.1 hypothetical protein HBH52_141170 [Parastagonospora nodorum]KAH3998874.1 hypothetical protein HBI10_128120 [Parastagonospora nodorum]KAH4033694.1 hypothetical protein HBI09_111740 [Parastagonospora nodorum]
MMAEIYLCRYISYGVFMICPDCTPIPSPCSLGHEQTSLHGALGQRLRYVRALAKMAALRSNDDEVRVLGQHEAILLAVADPETGLVLLAKCSGAADVLGVEVIN